jgi:hypothetical protein
MFSMETRSEMEADHESADNDCICCSGAYESFEEITSVIEEKQKVKKIKATKGPASQEQIEKLMDARLSEIYENRDKMVEKEKEVKEKEKLMDAKLSEKYVAQVAEWRKTHDELKPSCELLKSGSATCQCTECHGSVQSEGGSVLLFRGEPFLERFLSIPEEVCLGSATCQCTKCRGEHSDGSVHSEDCLDLLTTTDI